MSTTTNYLSQGKLEELRKELEFLSTARRKEIAEALEFAKSLGDLSENAEYHQAREEQARTEDRIAELEGLLKDAVVVTEKHGNVVQMGNTVEIKRKGSKDVKKYTLVGSQESNISAGMISNESPLGAAMLGKKKGEAFVFRTPDGGKVECEIVKID